MLSVVLICISMYIQGILSTNGSPVLLAAGPGASHPGGQSGVVIPGAEA